MSQDDKVPIWMKVMQNGSIAEARARAFLLNRFWILERSVDINGADFIIQRRITKSNLLDEEAPRLGVVQVKFLESSTTTHQIHQEYILDSEGKPRKEFFILFHTGDEDSGEIYFLSAEDIHSGFPIKLRGGDWKYSIPGRKIIDNLQYKVLSSKLVLDRIEQQLRLADFKQNRRFISWSLPIAIIDADHIIQDFKEPISNWWGSIPDGFHKLKKAIADSLIDISETYDRLKEIAEESDPIKAIEILQRLESDCRDNTGWRIRLPEELDNQNFREICWQHQHKINSLKESGLLDSFLSLRDYFNKQIIDYLADRIPFRKGMVHYFKFTMAANFRITACQHHITDIIDFLNDKDKSETLRLSHHLGVVHNQPNEILAYWQPASFIEHCKTVNDLNDYFLSGDPMICFQCMEAAYDEKYYEVTYAKFNI